LDGIIYLTNPPQAKNLHFNIPVEYLTATFTPTIYPTPGFENRKNYIIQLESLHQKSITLALVQLLTIPNDYWEGHLHKFYQRNTAHKLKDFRGSGGSSK
jgi:hypothetical protein